MKLFVVEEVPAFTRKQCVGMSCDICGLKSNCDEWPTESNHDIQESELWIKGSVRTGYSYYGDGGSGQGCEVDICPKCFYDKLVPWINGLGGTAEVVDWDF